MRKAIFISVLALMVLLAFGLPAFAEEAQPDIEGHIYEFPEVPPSYLLWGGYRFATLKGSARAAEFDYMRDGLAAGGLMVAFPFPHRFHIELDVINAKDNFTDIRYAYGDALLFRFVRSSLFHNLPNIGLVDIDPATASPGVLRLDSGLEYGIRTSISKAFGRYKVHDFPLHFYIDGMFVDKRGDMQQRFMGGAGYFNNIVRVSERRIVDWRTTDITLGTNAHLGPVEVDLSHTEKRFSAEDNILSFDYAAAGFFPPIRAAGTFPHNVLSDLEGSTNTLKIHSSYTGKIVASATFSNIDRRNQTGGAESDYFIGAASLMYMPLTNLSMVVRYRHQELDVDNPDVIPANYLGFPDYTTAITDVRDSISSRTNTVSTNIVYKPVGALRLGLNASYKDIDRRDHEDWGEVPVTTREKTGGLTADWKPMKNLKLSAGYTHKEFENPAYNYQPNRSDSERVSVTYTPLRWLSAFLAYERADEERDSIHFEPFVDEAILANDRNTQRDKFMGNLTFLVRENLTLNTGYTYWHYKVEQDLVYGEAADNNTLDEDVRYRDFAWSYTAGVGYRPVEKLDLQAAVTYTEAEGGFFPKHDKALLPVSIASFSRLNQSETAFDLRGRYDVGRGCEVGLDYRYSTFNEMVENPENPEDSDGMAQIILVSVTKRW